MALKTNGELRKQARKALEGNWDMALCFTFITYVIVGMPAVLFCNSEIALYSNNAVWTLVCLPLLYGFCISFLDLVRGKRNKIGFLFDGYRNFVNIFFPMLLRVGYTFLWSLLFIVPGIIKSLSYAMTPFVMHDHPEMRYDEPINESMRLMQGKKMKLFMLYLSFIGWGILCLLTFGIGFIFLAPYVHASEAAFYEDLVAEDKGYSEEYVPFNETV